MSPFFSHSIVACFFVALTTSASAQPPGFLEGHLKIIAGREVELAEGNAQNFSAGNYTEYPLIILSQGEKKEIMRITADRNGNYRVTLPPGDYILDVQRRPAKGHVRAKPQQFTIVSNQTVHINMDIDTGIR